MMNCRQLGNQFAKMMENERKCGEFVSFLSKRINAEKQKYPETKFKPVDQSTLDKAEAQIYTQSQSSNLKLNISQLTNSKRNETHLLQSIKNSNRLEPRSIFEEITQNDNEFLSQQSLHSNNFNQYDQNQNDPSMRNQESNFAWQKITTKNDNFYTNQSGETENLEAQEEYFELKIIDKSMNEWKYEELGDQCHQVKIFQPTQQKSQAQPFNLSNFSSFNGKNVSSSHQQTIQSEFYQKQLIFLIKKIELIHGKKLSARGIEKIVQQLHRLTNTNTVQNGYEQPKPEPKKHKFTEIFTSKLSYSHIVNSNLQKQKQKSYHNQNQTQKKPNFSSQPQTQPSKKRKLQKDKLPLVNIYASRKETNKQNIPKTTQNQDKSKIIKQKSLSPLSYRVLMEKKKQQNSSKIKQNQKNKQNQLNSHSFRKPLANKTINHDVNSRSPSLKKHNIQKPSKPLTLKIIMQHSENLKTKTISVENWQNDKSLMSEVQKYCEENQINKKNTNIIYEALLQKRPIITLKDYQ